jgi:hypothetical protein
MKYRYILAIAVIAFSSTFAVAGFVQPAPVMIDTDNMYAQGDMWTARTADNDTDFIGCGIRHFDDGMGNELLFGFCQAGNADVESFTCFTQDEDLLGALASIGDFSFITFNWNEDGDCTRIGVSTQSFYLPNFEVDDDDDDDD